MNQNTQRVGLVIGAVHRLLKARCKKPGETFFIDMSRPLRGLPMFKIVHRAPTGERWQVEDGQPKKYLSFDGPTSWELDRFIQSSPDDDEAARRIILHYVDGVPQIGGQTEPGTPAQEVNLAAIETLVAKMVAERLASMGASPEQAEEAAHRATQELAPEVARAADVPLTNEGNMTRAKRKGSTGKRPKAPGEKTKKREIDMWAQRVEDMGYQEPMAFRKDGALDGRWIRRAQSAWDEHVEQREAAHAAD